MSACIERHVSRVDVRLRRCPLVNFQLPINIERHPVIYRDDEAVCARRKIDRPLPCGIESTNRFQDITKDAVRIARARELRTYPKRLFVALNDYSLHKMTTGLAARRSLLPLSLRMIVGEAFGIEWA